MRKEGFEKIAEGHKLIQEGYLLLAEENLPEGVLPLRQKRPTLKRNPKK